MRAAQAAIARRRAAGFTLIELLVAAALTGLVMTILLGVQLAIERQQERGFRLVEANQHLRTGLDMIARDLRMAGSGCGNRPIFASFGHLPLPPRYPVLPGPSATGIDSVEIIGGQDGVSARLAAPMPGELDDIQVTDTSGFRSGEMVVVSSGLQGHLFQLTGVVGNRLEHDGDQSPWNMGGADAWPALGYPAGARVTQVEYVRYYVDHSDVHHPALMRWRASEASPSFVGKDVERLRLLYVEGDTLRPDPVDPLLIRSITVELTTVGGAVVDPTHARRQLTTTAAPRILD